MSHETTETIFTDPVCGMQVTADSAAGKAEFEGTTYYFCSTHCQAKFEADPSAFVSKAHDCCAHEADPVAHSCCHSALSPLPKGHGDHENHEPVKPSPKAKYFCPMCPGVESDRPGTCPKCGMALEATGVPEAHSKTVYTCPMHPEIQQDHPGSCPICGMTLEPKTVSAEPADDGELRDMTRRLWIGAALALPVFLLAMGHMVPSAPEWLMGDVSRWFQFGLATPVVLWAGWPFFARGGRSLVTRHLNMFTLIAIGVGTAFGYSAIAMLLPGAFPHAPGHHPGDVAIYFESAAMIVVLVLVGQVLELRARRRTGAALRALLDLAPKTARLVTGNGEHEIRSKKSQPARSCVCGPAKKCRSMA